MTNQNQRQEGQRQEKYGVCDDFVHEGSLPHEHLMTSEVT